MFIFLVNLLFNYQILHLKTNCIFDKHKLDKTLQMENLKYIFECILIGLSIFILKSN